MALFANFICATLINLNVIIDKVLKFIRLVNCLKKCFILKTCY